MEIRTFLREMEAGKQTQFFARYGDNLPADNAMAILEIPAEFSGAPKSRHELLTTKTLQAQHAAEIAEISEFETAITAAESAVRDRTR